MPRYTKQRDTFRCGPIAILNSIKWTGIEAPYSQFVPIISRLSRCEPPEGTSHGFFDQALRIVGQKCPKPFQVRRINQPYLFQIEDHLRADGAVILNYYWRQEYLDARHFLLITGLSPSGQTLYTVNGHREGRALRAVRRQTFVNHHLRFQRVDESFKAWFLTRI